MHRYRFFGKAYFHLRWRKKHFRLSRLTFTPLDENQLKRIWHYIKICEYIKIEDSIPIDQRKAFINQCECQAFFLISVKGRFFFIWSKQGDIQFQYLISHSKSLSTLIIPFPKPHPSNHAWPQNNHVHNKVSILTWLKFTRKHS